MTDQAQKVECGYVGPDGVKCVEMIGTDYFSKRSHMKKAHGIVPAKKAKPEKTDEDITKKAKEIVSAVKANVAANAEFVDPAIVKMNARAAIAVAEQMDRLRTKAPNVMFGVSGDQSELDQKTQWAAKRGLYDAATETPHWVRHDELDMAADDGRRTPLNHGRPVRIGNLSLTVRPKAIADALHNEHQDRLRNEYKQFIVKAEEDKEQARAIVPELASVPSQ